MDGSVLDPWAPRALAVLRIITALLFMQHGLAKLFAVPAPIPGVPDPLPLLLQIAGWMEVIGAPLLILGLFTRPIALLLSGEMAAAYWIAHASQKFWPILNGGELAILYCFIFLYLVFAGPGAWSLDTSSSRNQALRTTPAQSLN